MSDIEVSPAQKDCGIPSKKKRNKEKSKSSVLVNSDDKEGKSIPESLQNEKPASEK